MSSLFVCVVIRYHRKDRGLRLTNEKQSK